MKEDITYFSTPEKKPPFYISMSGISYCDGSYHIKRPDSHCTVVEYVISGKGTVSDGERTFVAKGGDIYIMRQNQIHDYKSDAKDPWVKMFINIRGLFAEELLASYGFDKDIVISCEGMEEDFHRIIDITKDRSLSDSEIFSRAVLEFHSFVIKLSEKRNSTGYDDMAMLRDHLAKNTDRIVSNKELSELIHRCEDYCIKKFSTAYGKTPYEYQIDKKINAAKMLLKSTGLTVCEIAEKLGYSDQHYFSNLFKKRCGVSPTKYKKQSDVI